jgi:hypothetical protein
MRRAMYPHTPKPVASALKRLFAELRTTVVGAHLGCAPSTIAAWASTDERSAPITVNAFADVVRLGLDDGSPNARELAWAALNALTQMVGYRAVPEAPGVLGAHTSPLTQFGEMMRELGEYTQQMTQALADGDVDQRERQDLLAQLQQVQLALDGMRTTLSAPAKPVAIQAGRARR